MGGQAVSQQVDPAIQQITEFISSSINEGQDPIDVVINLVNEEVDQQTIAQAFITGGYAEEDVTLLFEQVQKKMQPPGPASAQEQTRDPQEIARNQTIEAEALKAEAQQKEMLGAEQDAMAQQLQAKSGIEIKPENKGKFTAWAKARGMSVQAAANKVMSNKDEYPPSVVNMANFAKNAAGWNKEEGGAVSNYTEGVRQREGSYNPPNRKYTLDPRFKKEGGENKTFEPHFMYKGSRKIRAKDMATHLRLKERGYTHKEELTKAKDGNEKSADEKFYDATGVIKRRDKFTHAPNYMNPVDNKVSNTFDYSDVGAFLKGGYNTFFSGQDENKDGLKDGVFRDNNAKGKRRDLKKGDYYDYEVNFDPNDPNTYMYDNLDLYNTSKGKGGLRTIDQFTNDVNENSRVNYNPETGEYDSLISSRKLDRNTFGNLNAYDGENLNYFTDVDEDTKNLILGTQDDPEGTTLGIDKEGNASSYAPGADNPDEYETMMGRRNATTGYRAPIEAETVSDLTKYLSEYKTGGSMIPTGSNGQPTAGMIGNDEFRYGGGLPKAQEALEIPIGFNNKTKQNSTYVAPSVSTIPTLLPLSEKSNEETIQDTSFIPYTFPGENYVSPESVSPQAKRIKEDKEGNWHEAKDALRQVDEEKSLLQSFTETVSNSLLGTALSNTYDEVHPIYEKARNLAYENPVTRHVWNQIDPYTLASDALALLGVPAAIITQTIEAMGDKGDGEFNWSEIEPMISSHPDFKENFTFTTSNGQPIKTTADVLEIENPIARILVDLISDPTTYVGAGLAKIPQTVGKLAKATVSGTDKVIKLVRSGEGIKKLARKRLGIPDEFPVMNPSQYKEAQILRDLQNKLSTSDGINVTDIYEQGLKAYENPLINNDDVFKMIGKTEDELISVLKPKPSPKLDASIDASMGNSSRYTYFNDQDPRVLRNQFDELPPPPDEIILPPEVINGRTTAIDDFSNRELYDPVEGYLDDVPTSIAAASPIGPPTQSSTISGSSSGIDLRRPGTGGRSQNAPNRRRIKKSKLSKFLNKKSEDYLSEYPVHRGDYSNEVGYAKKKTSTGATDSSGNPIGDDFNNYSQSKKFSDEVSDAGENLQSGKVYTGSDNVSTDSFMNQMRQLKKLSDQGKGDVVFLGYKRGNDWSNLSNVNVKIPGKYDNKKLSSFLVKEMELAGKRKKILPNLQKPYVDDNGILMLPIYGMKAFKEGGSLSKAQVGTEMPIAFEEWGQTNPNSQELYGDYLDGFYDEEENDTNNTMNTPVINPGSGRGSGMGRKYFDDLEELDLYDEVENNIDFDNPFDDPSVKRKNKFQGGLNRFLNSGVVDAYGKVSDFAVKGAGLANSYFDTLNKNKAIAENRNNMVADKLYGYKEDPFMKRGTWDINTGTFGSEGQRTVANMGIAKQGGEIANVDSIILAKLIAAGADIEIL